MMEVSPRRAGHTIEIRFGDSFDVMPTLAANSVAASVCDPPYG